MARRRSQSLAPASGLFFSANGHFGLAIISLNWVTNAASAGPALFRSVRLVGRNDGQVIQVIQLKSARELSHSPCNCVKGNGGCSIRPSCPHCGPRSIVMFNPFTEITETDATDADLVEQAK